MLTYILKRLVLIIPTLFFIIFINFVVIQIAPGGPVEQAIEQAKFSGIHELGSVGGLDQTGHTNSSYEGSRGLSPEMLAQIKQQYGFDHPAAERFWMMLKGYAHLDFGTSFFKGKSVLELMKERLPVTLSLGLWGTLIIYLISIPLGIRKAVKHGEHFDHWSAFFLVAGYAVPVFIFAILLMAFFAGGSFFKWFPLQGLVSENFDQLSFFDQIKDYLWHMTLPLIAMTVGGFAKLTYLTKFSFLEELHKPYVLGLRARGLTANRILYRHVFKNAILVVIAGLPDALLAVFLVGNFLIEIVFNLNGIGLLGFEAIQQRDYPVIFGTLFLYTLVGMLLRLISDILYRLIDPRLDFERRELR
ncbi:MAG: microcin C ABC transporter permease YejB [Gammaproteobacteria bacterium]|nr:microcin C ABC transporter permease YejB [Gammaproteobacteria bacterium]